MTSWISKKTPESGTQTRQSGSRRRYSWPSNAGSSGGAAGAFENSPGRFVKTMKDPEFLAEIEKRNYELDPTPGEKPRGHCERCHVTTTGDHRETEDGLGGEVIPQDAHRRHLSCFIVAVRRRARTAALAAAPIRKPTLGQWRAPMRRRGAHKCS